MPALTNTRARNRGGHAAQSNANGTTAVHDDDDMPRVNGKDSYDDLDEKRRLGNSSPRMYEKSPSSRPFGSNVNSASSGYDGTLSSKERSSDSWVTSEDLKNEKAKARAGKPGLSGNGPLRDYGGGMGVVGQGEFKLLVVITVLAAIVRLWRLDRPNSVVFDEVHFGGFASKYINGKFFMDVHPPLAKLLITFAAWFAGYKGDFDFKDIGKDYIDAHVPYIAMRLLPASLGIALIPLAYLTLRSLGCRAATALLAALLLTFENGLITQSRFVLLDSPLLFFTGLTTFFWVGFAAEDARRPGSSMQGPFTRTWWAWLAMTGLCLGATLSSKWVGLFTTATIGLATCEQLWQILGDTKVPMKILGRHFVARSICLIVIPVAVYMFWFGVHFAALTHSGDGDGFMSSEFQHTLRGHGMPDTYADVVLGSKVSIKHLHTQGGYLHTHPHSYPGGSKQQQITLYPHRDDNNDWIFVNETQQIGHESDPRNSTDLTYITDKMFLRLHHPLTSKKLHSHDVRPPVSEVDFQNEVSAYGFENFDGDANDNFQIEFEMSETDSSDRYAKKRLRALRTKFRLRHVLTGCYLFSHKVKLPDWGFEQQEVTCNKNPTKANSVWYVETNTHDHLPAKAQKINYRRPGFWRKFTELQGVMWRTNAGLTDRHAYDSRPHHWPILRRGINFWVKDHRQVYLIGNPVTWWLSTCAVLAYAAVRGLLILRQKRGYTDLNNTVVGFYDRLCGFLFVGWALHYFPFFIMQRQLFLHHYFPALYYSVLLLASVFDLATSALKPKFRVQLAAIILICALWSYAHFSPLTYAGRWTKTSCEKSKWLHNWDFSCNDFHAHLSDYDQLAAPTPSKLAGQTVPVGDGGETPVDATIIQAVAPARNAFLADADHPPAPKSSMAAPELFKVAEEAHIEAEKREDAERKPEELAKIRESEPTRAIPGADLPASVVAEQVKENVLEENAREAPVPLEEAAPTPSTGEDGIVTVTVVDKDPAKAVTSVVYVDVPANAEHSHIDVTEVVTITRDVDDHGQGVAEHTHTEYITLEDDAAIPADGTHTHTEVVYVTATVAGDMQQQNGLTETVVVTVDGTLDVTVDGPVITSTADVGEKAPRAGERQIRLAQVDAAGH